jgi:hypothetical protein
MPFKTISDLAREFGCRPRDISDLFYARKLDEGRCAMAGGRRLIPADYQPAVRQALADAGKLPQPAEACAS